MKISISTIGTRGDVQPYAILGKALAERGHEVTLSTAKNFESLVKSYGINFHPVDVDYQEILNSDEGKKILKANLFAIQRNLDKLIFPLIEQSLNECYQLAQSSDLFIYRPKTLSDVFTGQLKTKSVRAAVVPAMEETTAFINPIFSGFWLPNFLNRWSYKLNNLRYQFLRKPINQFCQQNGLPEHKPSKRDTLSLYGISEHFLERPKDWGSEHKLTGFWFPENTRSLPYELDDYLSSGEPPILITFGSMPVKKEIAAVIVESAGEMNERFLIAASWGDWHLEDIKMPENVKIIETAPFELLFPRVKAIVHHGGIGTTAECLRAGKPMFVCPVLYPVGDQYFWGDLAYKKGLGVKPVPLSRLTASVFKERIAQLTNLSLGINCTEMAHKISEENGIEKAVELIEQLL
ncbi:glycosyltransferase [Pedobacter sp. SYSU D00535]|uniref:glycosyltransferase n=1 Tax=Pedobacter sp. SYSU D00535 TaxID=2810308 RepID=UPI001A968A9E|nr:glycosyltransferase [Pedobacter sp. SYSU D00535]